MAKIYSPLRYPGGKSCLSPLISAIIKGNELKRCHYAEPYAGGCGLALSMLFSGQVSDIHINDLDPSIWCFWEAVLNHTDDLIALIKDTEINVEQWHIQRDIQLNQDTSDPVRLGFATFFLNRTNRSGIIKGAGVIGGLSQEGNYKMDCRFNKYDLIDRITRIVRYRDRINLYRLDALEFIENESKNFPTETFFCIDPPYFKKGSSLYTSFYGKDDHERISRAIKSLDRPWIVTYDDNHYIRYLYDDHPIYSFDINYSIQTKRKGTELMIASRDLALPSAVEDRKIVA